MATFTQLASGNWRVQVRRKTRYVAETFRRRKDGEEWALEMERNIDRNGSAKPRVLQKGPTRPCCVGSAKSAVRNDAGGTEVVEIQTTCANQGLLGMEVPLRRPTQLRLV